MSITYKLELGAPVAPSAVVSALTEGAAGIAEAHTGTKGSLRGGGWFDVDVAEYDPPDPVEQEFGFAPTVEVYFGLSKSGDFEAQETDVLRLVLAVLARIPGDALLHFEHDEVWLLRRGGRLTVNGALWKPQQLALLSPPYETAPLAFG
ncbi:hypothetical protein FNH05_12020 [Amycolatopsis rhizosphaerae]|uniref:Uncharacterized protein n=1 Tax=Amycolatopsis rhizosphaerae TaxID=2053003 RepID=A0A558CX35_9PSEU|nr:SitI3 family protein [Amycolatopsis rhizosphaerae]TVT53283.1 hypothetical protein FNH05_12020 [Amycolatopsis rhizosphaerae]